jgi:hypothetical protein
MDHPLERDVGGRDDGSQTQERERRAHLRTASCCEERAAARSLRGHHAANIERHDAELEREAADAARRHE